MVFPVGMFRQIALIEKHELNLICRVFVEPGGLRRITIQNVKKKISRSERSFGAHDPFAFKFVLGIAQASRVQQSNRNAAQVYHFFNCVACRARRFADDGAVVTKKSIQQTRFPGVGRAVDDRADPLAQNPSLFGRREQIAHYLPDGIETRAQFAAFIRRDVFLRKIDCGFHMRQHFDQLCADGSDLRTKPSFQLLIGGAKREIALGADQIHDRFGLRQIHLAVQEGALGEFARSRRACASMEAGLENARRHKDSTVAADLDQIFTRVTGGRTMD